MAASSASPRPRRRDDGPRLIDAYETRRGREAMLRFGPATGPVAVVVGIMLQKLVELAHDASVLVMTDGFYRLVDLYGLYTDAALVEACIAHGLKAQLDKLRNYEATSARTAERAVKASDDASAAIWTIS